MPLHKYPVHLWQKLRLRQGIYARLPAHFLRSLEEERTPTPVHYKPHGAKFKINPKNGQRERVEDVPIPIYYPPESQQGLWGGEGVILGYRYANNDKTPKEDLCSKFGMDLKRGMLLRLARQDPQLHPDDPERRQAIYDKYKGFVIPEAEAEWVGLTLEEAVEKQRLLEEKDPVPLFKVYVEELVQRLQEQVLSRPAVVQKRAGDHA
ncbi:39S ribosomal protein L28, mitochondrial isoform X2 [Cricetulus griseus]|uniref:39S ribosomal protein L28, mitochondrial isoform X2 n=1 Tax=Cricetulus griseus TaxID=10029 RepID=A0A9J7GB55_CRIGR|nr:39S ribosomal protein L28, mitochondrial isoform X2 [Cricetulus griseus]XP_027291749.1 39S ribosomal protein L28, mitochondrial isoform X2 [Cricetulus griseus]